MNANKGLTRVDAIIAVAFVALVLAQAAVLNAGGRERSKREVCLANLRMLTAAWKAYADDNAGKLVNGATPSEGDTTFCVQCPDCPTGTPYISKAKVNKTNTAAGHMNELPWVGGAFYGMGTQLPECAAKCAIESGALYKYVQDSDIYRCPTGNKGEYITYTFVDAMNGMPGDGDCGRGKTALKNINQITKTATQIVFIDEGKVTPDSFAVYYNQENWWDPPPVRHSGGVCVSFADGHSAFHKWKSQETIAIGSGSSYYYSLTTCAGKNDLYWMQIGCWGQLGYTPSCPVNID
ncbi:MAG: hypothetical protein ABSF37_00625 [Sedimentisphaerales bacterium]|jgi:prepilin-type processing-associated H-X9-DG protein